MKKKYQKPKITSKKISLNFFFSQTGFLDNFNIVGDMYAQSGCGSCCGPCDGGGCDGGCGQCTGTDGGTGTCACDCSCNSCGGNTSCDCVGS